VVWVIIDEAHIGTIAVTEQFRNQGIAEKLIRYGLNSAALKGAETAMLEVRRSNESAIRLYTRLGFVVDGVRERYYQDNHEDAILMSLPDL
ncbi:GNAT family N-acetyltransferase, partial [Klebsiella pneumoniae]|nr:GNAT family N-acetyltransferase [Klebsiella pneumoniae]